MTLKLTLPWPPARLQPNARALWPERRRLAKGYKSDCYFAAKAGGARVVTEAELALTVTFCPPTAAKRDRDNCVAAFKAGQDVLAEALGCDDSIFVPTYRMGEPVKGGAVVVEVFASDLPSANMEPADARDRD